MFIQREMAPLIIKAARQFPVIALMGPRQSGKTTLARMSFPSYHYVSLENLDTRRLAQEDPRGFLASFDAYEGGIIDEIQQVPELFSYIQGVVDEAARPGKFILTGSHNFALLESISQSLAGRVALFTLLPLTCDELAAADMLPATLQELLFKGMYPRLYAQEIDPAMWISDYITTYIERDVRRMIKITDLLAFQRFLKLCAARVGNLLNYAELARDADISSNTAKAWLSILHASYITFELSPHHENFTKRIIKQPKLYFYDTGIVCSLLQIGSAQELFAHPIRGALFESFVISQLYAYRLNRHLKPNLYFWRDVQGHEVDLLFEKSFGNLMPVEIKSTMTFQDALYKGINAWQKIAEQVGNPGYLVYAGDMTMQYKQHYLFGWRELKKLMVTLES